MGEHVLTRASRATPRTLIVDCGSSGTRGKFYCGNAHGGVLVTPWTTAEGEVTLPGLAEVVEEGEAAVRHFLDRLASSLTPAGVITGKVVLGATGGMRDAMGCGSVTLAMLEAFALALAARTELGGLASFKLLTGAEEAVCEHAAVKYMAQKLSIDGASRIGMFSSGGATSQVAYYPDAGAAGVQVFSLLTNIKEANSIMLERGVNGSGIDAVLEFLDQRFEREVSRCGMPGQMHGTFGAIELLGMVGEEAGIAHCLISASDAVEAIATCLAAWKRKAQAVDMKAAGWGVRQLLSGPTALLALRLLSHLHPGAGVYFANWWRLPAGERCKPSWPLGLYLRSEGA